MKILQYIAIYQHSKYIHDMTTTPKDIRNNLLGQKLVDNLKKRHFEAFFCPTAQEAVEKVSALIPDNSSVTWGGTMTLR